MAGTENGACEASLVCVMRQWLIGPPSTGNFGGKDHGFCLRPRPGTALFIKLAERTSGYPRELRQSGESVWRELYGGVCGRSLQCPVMAVCISLACVIKGVGRANHMRPATVVHLPDPLHVRLAADFRLRLLLVVEHAGLPEPACRERALS